MLSELATWIDRAPALLIYVALGLGAAIENVLPAVPADTFVVLGGFLTAIGDLEARWIFTATWFCNVASALVMYRVGRTHGRPFFEHGWGRRVLNPHQMERMGSFYARWGTMAIFFTRFLPGLRSVVPVFAGVSRQPFMPVALPIAIASAIWYGALVWAGALAGQNLDAVTAALGGANRALLVVALVVIAAVAAWWWRTRLHGRE